jgi:transcriptional regulator with XRE-family HTH domain
MGALRISFGRACFETRLSLDVSRQALADRVGISVRYMAMIERGRANPSLRLVERIVDALGLDTELLIRAPIFLPDRISATRSTRDARRMSIGGSGFWVGRLPAKSKSSMVDHMAGSTCLHSTPAQARC